MLCAYARVVDGQLHRMSAEVPRQVIACLAAVLVLASPVLAASPQESETTSHLLIGMTPNQGFEITCEDSVLFVDPVVASDLGIMEFHVEGRHGPYPNTICIRIPAPPQILGEHASAVADVSATISWTTDRPATSRVDYGLTNSYGTSTPLDPALVMAHDVALTSLDPEVTYHYRVISTDAFGNQTVGTDRTFATQPLLPSFSGVSVEDVTATSFRVTWTTSRPCDSSVEYGLTESYGGVTPTSPELVTDHDVAVESLEPNTTYHFRACGTDDLNRTVCSPDGVITTLAGDVTIFDLAVTDTTATTATIEWSTTTPGSSWVVYGEGGSYSSQAGDDNLVTEHVVTLEGLNPNTLYGFRALSFGPSGTSDESDDHEFRTPCAPLEISGPFVAGATHTSVTLSWTTSRPSVGYVEYGEDEGYGHVVECGSEPSIGHEVTLEGLDAGAEYHVRAVSTDEFGCTAVSDDVVVSTNPYALSIFAISVPETTATSATISWRTNNASVCQVEYGPTANYGFLSEENPIPLGEHAVMLADLAPRTLYYFRVHANDVHGQEEISARFTFSTHDQNGPGGLLIHGVVANGIGPTFASVCWQTNVDASSTVHYGLTTDCDLSVSDPEMTSNHCLMLTDLTPGTRHYYRVSSEDSGHFTAESQTYSFVTPQNDTVPPGTPLGLTASPCQGGVTLTWQGGTEYDLACYRVYRRSEGTSPFGDIAEISVHETSYVDRDALDRWTYAYAVTAVDLEGNESAMSATVTATAGLGGEGRVWVYPNPVTQKATTISFSPPLDCDGSYIVSVYDASGRLVKTVAKGTAGTDVSSVRWHTRDTAGKLVSSGIYFCEVSFSSQSVRSKIRVVR